MLAAGVFLLISGVRGRTLIEVLRGETGEKENPETGFGRFLDVQAFRERAEFGGVTADSSGGSEGFADLVGLSGTKGGARGMADRSARIGAQHGLGVISAHRPKATTTSGNISDHSQNDAERAARDLSNGSKPTPEMDAAVEEIARSFGQRVNGKKSVVKTFNYQGFRVQLLYRTNTGGNHFNHIHVGVRKA